MRGAVTGCLLLVTAFLLFGSTPDRTGLASAFDLEVDKKLAVPPAEQERYGNETLAALGGYPLDRAQFVVVVDRNPNVQAAMIFWITPGAFSFIGASPASTGKPGRFEHFATPLGVFPHTLDQLDFRALGTKNELGMRGYGRAGMRVFDFGWQTAVRGWGRGGEGKLRLQMHATDPDTLEKRMGTAQSKGCIRIPATLNVFLDRHAILDADYDAALAQGKTFWLLLKSRMPTPWSGRYLVIVDTERDARPDWTKTEGNSGVSRGAVRKSMR
jgi:hypothetical protein